MKTTRPADHRLPLSALLSQVLVAFIIQFDNEFEHRTPHRTTRHSPAAGLPQGPWLASMAMWCNCMQFVDEEGVKVSELEKLARTTTNLNGMQRWGYITIAPDPADSRPKQPRSHWIIRATPKGRQAREVWRPLFSEIEERWKTRFGKNEIEQLRKALCSVITQIDLELPDCLPILGYGLFSKGPKQALKPPASRDLDSSLPLSALLSRILLAFAIEFEGESDLSLAISADVLRVLDAPGVRVRDLPRLSGVSKEAISMAMGILQKKNLVVVEPDQTGRVKIAYLTAQGLVAQETYLRLVASIEERWKSRYGNNTIAALRKLLERLAAEPMPQPYPDGWRAAVPKPNTLPHYPMVLHRGGFPDGS